MNMKILVLSGPSDSPVLLLLQTQYLIVSITKLLEYNVSYLLCTTTIGIIVMINYLVSPIIHLAPFLLCS